MGRAMLACSCLLAAASVQPAVQDWTSLDRVQAGERVEIMLRDGARFSGQWEAAAPDRLTVRKGNQVREAARAEVERVWTLGPKSRGRAALYGLLIGFVPGLVVGVTAAEQITDQNDVPASERIGAGALIGAIWGGIGAGIGAAVGTQPRTLIYRAPKAAHSGAPRPLTGIAGVMRPAEAATP